MATNLSVYDLENYPSRPKTVTIDLKSVVPYGSAGDEKWVASATTTATASGSLAIQDTYANDTKVGWSKSSGIPAEPFSVDETHKLLKVAIDEAVAAAATIEIPVTGLPQTGNEVAAAIQRALSALTVTGGVKAANVSYLNAKCYYEGGRFIIVSGSLGPSYTGSSKTCVHVAPGATNDVSALIGFDIPTESETLALTTIKETYTTAIVSSSVTVPVNSVSGFAIGDCVMLKTAAGVTLYRYLDNVSAPNLTVNAAVSVAENTLVQVLRPQDATGGPVSYYTDIDSVVRHNLDLLTNQINFAG